MMMTAREKIEETVDEFLERDPADAQEAAMQMFAGQLAPSLLAKLSDDPAEVDGQLEGIAVFVLAHRGDDAGPPRELLAGLEAQAAPARAESWSDGSGGTQAAGAQSWSDGSEG